MEEKIATVKYKDREFRFAVGPSTEGIVAEIFSDNYTIIEKGLSYGKGDVILDLGANEGVFSIFMAVMFPGVKIYAYEPVPRTFAQLMRNLNLNKITPEQVVPNNTGVAAIACDMEMIVSKDHSGGSTTLCTFNPDHHIKPMVKMNTLDNILANIPPVKLLKIDIEGMEYDVLYNCKSLDRVEQIVGEFHSNERLRGQATKNDPNELATYLGSMGKLLYFDRCPMAE